MFNPDCPYQEAHSAAYDRAVEALGTDEARARVAIEAAIVALRICLPVLQASFRTVADVAEHATAHDTLDALVENTSSDLSDLIAGLDSLEGDFQRHADNVAASEGDGIDPDEARDRMMDDARDFARDLAGAW